MLEKSLADVSFLAGMLVDKFLYHLPLYRQHQRLQNNGITLSRATLTNLTSRAIDLLSPIVDAQLNNILLSRILAMDETYIKAGRQEKASCIKGIFGQSMEIAMKLCSPIVPIAIILVCLISWVILVAPYYQTVTRLMNAIRKIERM